MKILFYFAITLVFNACTHKEEKELIWIEKEDLSYMCLDENERMPLKEDFQSSYFMKKENECVFLKLSKFEMKIFTSQYGAMSSASYKDVCYSIKENKLILKKYE
ncbi:MAG: hypothetical protein Q9M43_11965 [Sulfurimonas sp.]|nr:hypothetical protein [Sulfurimonas sp.]